MTTKYISNTGGRARHRRLRGALRSAGWSHTEVADALGISPTSVSNKMRGKYPWDGKDAYTQQVVHNAFLDFRKNQNVDKTGSKEVNSFLLVIPTDKAIVAPKDKVLQGEGPKIATREAWSGFVPEKVPGLVVVRYVDPKYYQGRMVHLEAGG